jgi:thermitase
MKILLLILLSSLSVSAQNFVRSNIDSSRLIVKVKSGSKIPKSNFALSSKKLFGNYIIYRTKNIEALKQDLENLPEVESVKYNFRWSQKQWPKVSKPSSNVSSGFLRDGETPIKNDLFNDPMLSKLWGLAEATQGVNLFNHLTFLNRNNIPKNKVLVAVVDTGVDVAHPDLSGKIWINKNEIAGNKIDDDQNGYVDDVNGIDTLTRDSQGRATAHLIDGHGHGTHVSGTIAAVQNNGIGIAGVSSHAEIMAIRTVPANGDETDVDVAESFIYAAKMGARIINCSFGKAAEETPGLVKDAIDEIAKINETVVIAAAGNDGKNIDVRFAYPASLPNENLIVVNATKTGGSITGFSNFGLKNSDIAAPGAAILSLTPKNQYASWDGTSMAAPHVSGVAAEILSIYPNLTATELKQALLKSAKSHSTLSGKSVTGGSIDVDLARKAAQEILKSRSSGFERRIGSNGSFQNRRF